MNRKLINKTRTAVATTRLTRRQVTPGATTRETRRQVLQVGRAAQRTGSATHWLLYAGKPVHPPGTLRERLRRTAVPLPLREALRVRQFLYAGEPVHRTGSPLRVYAGNRPSGSPLCHRDGNRQDGKWTHQDGGCFTALAPQRAASPTNK